MTSLDFVPPLSPFRQAILDQNLEKAFELVGNKEACPDVEYGESNLSFAITYCSHRPKLIEALILGQSLAVLECPNLFGNIPMVTAASLANVVAIDLLAKAGAKVFVHSAGGYSTLRIVVMDSLLYSQGMFEDQKLAYSRVLQAARVLIQHGVPADDYSGANSEPLVKSYIKKWNSTPAGDPHLLKFLVVEGAAAPSKEEVLAASPKNGEAIYNVIEQGLEERRAAIATELSAKMPNPLVTLIRGYVS